VTILRCEDSSTSSGRAKALLLISTKWKSATDEGEKMVRAINRLGRHALEFVEHLGRLALFTGRILVVCCRPPLRLRQLIDEVYKLGVLSLVLISVCGMAVGMVLGLQGYNTLVRFGAEDGPRCGRRPQPGS